jgi:signal transduction histidine kinase
MHPPPPADDPRERLLAAYQQALGHDLPNLLVAIQGMVQLLQTEEAERLNPEGREFLEQLVQTSRRAHEWSRALADVGCVVRDARGTAPESVEDAAREAGFIIKQLYPYIYIEYHLSHPAPRLNVGRSALQQVFVELFRSAAKALYGDPTPVVSVGGCDDGAGVEIWVAHSGQSFSERERERLFEPPAPGNDPHGSGGWGLFLVRQLVETWGGAVTAECSPTRGAMFRIRVPAIAVPGAGA